MAQKRSFLLYFDNYPMIQGLSDEQRGMLLTALFDYAIAAIQPDGKTIAQIMEAVPAMTEETKMACRFMCSNIKRDTQRWLNRQEGHNRKKAQREEQGSGGSISDEGKRRQAEEVERMRRDMAKWLVVE